MTCTHDRPALLLSQGWQPGDKLIVHNSLKTEDAKKHFDGKQVEEVVSPNLASTSAPVYEALALTL